MRRDVFLRMAYDIEPQRAEGIEDSLTRLTDLLESHSVPMMKKRVALKQIETYLQKKCKELDSLPLTSPEASLRRLRNELAHGKISSDVNFEPLYADLWKAIGRLAARLGPQQIENLLAYTLDVPNLRASERGASPAAITRMYRSIFVALPLDLQRKLFSKLLIRLFTDSNSKELLESRRNK